MDHGQVQSEHVGWLARFFGKKATPRIIREADLEAAMQGLPPQAVISATDTAKSYFVYRIADGTWRIRFLASAAWLPNEPTVIPNNTRLTRASVTSDSKILILEGLHRTRSMAREKVLIMPNLGGVLDAPGWLDFVFDAEGAILSDSSLELSGPWKLIPAK